MKLKCREIRPLQIREIKVSRKFHVTRRTTGERASVNSDSLGSTPSVQTSREKCVLPFVTDGAQDFCRGYVRTVSLIFGQNYAKIVGNAETT